MGIFSFITSSLEAYAREKRQSMMASLWAEDTRRLYERSRLQSMKRNYPSINLESFIRMNNMGPKEDLVGKEFRKETLRPGDDLNKAGVKFDHGKARLELVPPEGVLGVAEILAVGAKKYAARNWEQGMEWSRPYAAAQRHLYAWWSGEDRDPDTNKSHLWHAACNLFFLIAYEARKTGTDDRPKA
jgi:hypothetical protein